MSLQEQIKANLVKELYTEVDKMYDFMMQRFILSDNHQELIIKQLNSLKDNIHFILVNSELS